MFIVANRVTVAKSFQEIFEQRFRSRIGQIDQQPGFVRMQVLKPAKPEMPYLVLTSWVNQQAFETGLAAMTSNARTPIRCPKRPSLGKALSKCMRSSSVRM